MYICTYTRTFTYCKDIIQYKCVGVCKGYTVIVNRKQKIYDNQTY